MSQEERAWSRTLVASTGVALDHAERPAGPSHEWLEAGAADLDRPRLLTFAAHRDARIRETIALRPDCPMGVLATLAFDSDRTVRRAVAASPRMASAIADALATDRDQEVLKALARNPLTDEETLRRLEGHRRSEVRRIARQALAVRQSTPREATVQTARVEVSVPLELRDRWSPASAESSPSRERTASRFYAPRPEVPSRAPRPSAAPSKPETLQAYFIPTNS